MNFPCNITDISWIPRGGSGGGGYFSCNITDISWVPGEREGGIFFLVTFSRDEENLEYKAEAQDEDKAKI